MYVERMKELERREHERYKNEFLSTESIVESDVTSLNQLHLNRVDSK